MTMMLVSGIIGGLGLVCMISRRTLLGFLIGVQLLIVGATMVFVMAGVTSGVRAQGQVFGLFIALGGVAQLVVGYALSVRLFYLRKRVDMDEIRALRH
ncbi:MAG: NADH-quinone oxidoreductase subunit NuoK [Bdellovibrionota bacterium]